MNKRFWVKAVVLFLAGFMVSCRQTQLVDGGFSRSICYYVSPVGDDKNSGSKESPWKTIFRARDEIRKDKGKYSGDVIVYLRGGTYFLDRPFVLTPEDSGTKESRRIYKAWQDEEVVISGGVRLEKGRLDSQGYWHFNLPKVRMGQWSFCQLFVNGQRRYRPRLPQEGYYEVADELPPRHPAEVPIGPTGQDQFVYSHGAFSGDWKNLTDIEVVALHSWSASRLWVEGVDSDKHIVRFTGPTYSPDWLPLKKGNRYWIENVKDALTKPRQWYLDRPSGELTYLPEKTESLETAEIIAPRLSRLVEFFGDLANHEFVEYINFEGINFAHSNYILPPEGQSIGQAESILGGAIYGVGARFCVFQDCKVQHVGSYAVEWSDGCHDNKLLNCELTDLGAGGVKIGRQMLYGYDLHEASSHQEIENCLIACGGRIHTGAPGVLILSSHHNRIEHNEVRDFYYTGISVGLAGGESFPSTWAHHNIIAHNHIYKIGQGVLDDLAGIYAMGMQPGTIIRNNVIHDVKYAKYGAFGIYMDEGASCITIENNLCYDNMSPGFFQHYGKENKVYNNIFAFCGQGAVQFYRRIHENDPVYMERNILVSQTEPPVTFTVPNLLAKPLIISDNNLYWTVGNNQPLFMKDMTLAQRQAQGQDQHSLFADPLFMDSAKRDFHLQKESPAFAVGFEMFDYTKAGRFEKTP